MGQQGRREGLEEVMNADTTIELAHPVSMNASLIETILDTLREHGEVTVKLSQIPADWETQVPRLSAILFGGR